MKSACIPLCCNSLPFSLLKSLSASTSKYCLNLKVSITYHCCHFRPNHHACFLGLHRCGFFSHVYYWGTWEVKQTAPIQGVQSDEFGHVFANLESSPQPRWWAPPSPPKVFSHTFRATSPSSSRPGKQRSASWTWKLEFSRTFQIQNHNLFAFIKLFSGFFHLT